MRVSDGRTPGRLSRALVWYLSTERSRPRRPLNSALRLHREIRHRVLAALHGNLLIDLGQLLLPHLDGVVAGRNVFDREVAMFVSHRVVRIVDHNPPSVHPAVCVASYL